MDRKRSATRFLDGCDCLVCARFARVVGQRDRCAILCKTFGNGAANAPRRSSNKSGFSFESVFHSIFLYQSAARPPSTATSLAVMKSFIETREQSRFLDISKQLTKDRTIKSTV
jgi:hypothetical protein